MQTVFAAAVEPLPRPILDDEIRARLIALHQRIASRLPQIAERLVALAHAGASADSIEHERFCDLLVEWMRSGLVGPYDDAFRALRSRLGRRFLDRALLQGAVYATLLALRTEYRRCITTLYATDEGRRVLDAVDTLLDLELEVIAGNERDRHDHGAQARERDELGERLAALQTLTAGIAHEVRNPLNSAKLQLEVLERRLRRESVDVRLCEPSELARIEIEKLSDVLDELLEFASPPAMVIVRHDMMVIAREVIEAQRADADLHRITLTLHGPERAVAELDVAKMHTVLRHLLLNGIEAVGADGAIRMTVRAHVDRIRVEVVDDGPGIPSEIRARIYEPFFSTKGSCTGLGMSIVHSIIALHGGVVEIQSEPGATAVAISIPRRAR